MLKCFQTDHSHIKVTQHSTLEPMLICIANEQRFHHQKALFACEQRSSNKQQPQRELTAHSFIHSRAVRL